MEKIKSFVSIQIRKLSKSLFSVRWRRALVFTITYYLTYLILFTLNFLYNIQIQTNLYSFTIEDLLLNPWICITTVYNELIRDITLSIFFPLVLALIIGIISAVILSKRSKKIDGMFDIPGYEKNSIIVEILSFFFHVLKYLSLYKLFKWMFINPNSDDRRKIEYYVIGFTIFSFFLVMLWPANSLPLLQLFFLIFIMFRIAEILIVQINALFFDWFRDGKVRRKKTYETTNDNESKSSQEVQSKKPYVIRGFLRITLLLLTNYVEIVFYFAVFYQYFFWIFPNISVLDPVSAINFSFFTMTTFGHPSLGIQGSFAQVLTLSQAVIGVFMALLIISKFISLFPKAHSDDEAEKFLENENRKIEEKSHSIIETTEKKIINNSNQKVKIIKMKANEIFNCEIQIRKTLLDFYSSQLGGHSRIIIGFSAILFSLITVRNNLNSSSSSLNFSATYFSLFIASFFFCFLLMRYLMYGVLANSATHATIQINDDSSNFAKNRGIIRNHAIKSGMPLKIPLTWFLSIGKTPKIARKERVFGIILCLIMGFVVT